MKEEILPSEFEQGYAVCSCGNHVFIFRIEAMKGVEDLALEYCEGDGIFLLPKERLGHE